MTRYFDCAMISKEIVISWFKSLPGDGRIELICLLLDYCLSSEIRFIGTYLESAAQIDYFAFKTYESTANNPTDLSYLYLLDDAQVRRNLCLCLALLHSNNRQAAAVLYGNLNDFQPSSSLDPDVQAELALLFTMAANHPAFSFHQKHVLRSKLKVLRQTVTTSDLSETISDCSTGSSNFFPDSDREIPTIEPSEHNAKILDATSGEEETHEITQNMEASSLDRSENPATIPVNTPNIFVKELKVLNIQKRPEFKNKQTKRKDAYEYVIEVSWSDNTTEKVHRCYEEMFDFQCKLRKMYPTKVDENGQPWKLAFLPGKIRIFNKAEHKGERTPIPDISDYARLFSTLPKFVRGCDHVLKFFQEKPRSRDRKSKNSKKEDKSKNKIEPPKQTIKGNESFNKLTESSQSSLLTVKADDKDPKSLTSTKTTNGKYGMVNGGVLGRDENGNDVFFSLNGTVNTHKPELNTASLVNSIQNMNGFAKLNSVHKTSAVFTSSNAPVSVASPVNSIASPSHSPITSPVESPRPSPSHSPLFNHSLTTGSLSWIYKKHSLTVLDWLKTMRLHKYIGLLAGKSFNELLHFTDQDLDKLGLTIGAKRKLRVSIEMLRSRASFTSEGLAIIDTTQEYTSSPYLPPTVLSLSSGSFTQGYCSDTELIRRVSESDSECGSDVLSERAYSVYHRPVKPAPLNGCRLSCYNCGSLGHVGGQCMAPSMDKKSNYGFHLKYDGGTSPLATFT